ncbi:cutinase-domain-containing protein [Tothia fuscella]|uniref:Cutinase n=1 Tax=Tothia fuscella TaxID=1048955 RepID=A0A9P4NQP2_9PEZI|nr:cutinase-domain-containing protein [Tothia fuscella]
MKFIQLSILAYATAAIAAVISSVESRAVCTPQGSGGGSTENGVVNGNCCTDVTVIFARGTAERGNVGASAGPPLFKALRSKIGANRVTVQGVDYPADYAGFFAQGGTGGATMASLVKKARAQCPNTKVVVSGYSQGGQAIHNAFSKQGLSKSQVAAAVLFGDPQNGQKVGDLATADVFQDCHAGDRICESSGSFLITPAHTTYGQDAGIAAQFIVDRLGL